MNEENEKIWLEPKIAMQVINKILQGANSNGITVNVITIGKIVVSGTNGNGRDIQLSEISVDGNPLSQIGIEDQKKLPEPVLDLEQVPATLASAEKTEMRFSQGDYPKRRKPEDVPYYDLIENVIRTEYPECNDQVFKNYSCGVRQFFKFCYAKRGMFRIEEIGKDDLINYLEANLGILKKNSLTAKKGEILSFFDACEKQGIGKAIPRFDYHYGKKESESSIEPIEDYVVLP